MNLSIKNVPEELVERLRSQAKLNHRSMQGELMAIIDDAQAKLNHRSMQGELMAIIDDALHSWRLKRWSEERTCTEAVPDRA